MDLNVRACTLCEGGKGRYIHTYMTRPVIGGLSVFLYKSKLYFVAFFFFLEIENFLQANGGQ